MNAQQQIYAAMATVSSRALRVSSAQCAKAATVYSYCCGWLKLETCEALFRRNPAWRSA